ncbi:hypothetical protein CHCC14820_1821 [Bacillus paralicheniformis]|nr:hypothetical protein CHCC14820_1821 [Bacillus paralicheniformis]TWM28582.1 hypothetical protein CHCC14821_2090 [Bacillus paralicheniformis]
MEASSSCQEKKMNFNAFLRNFFENVFDLWLLIIIFRKADETF